MRKRNRPLVPKKKERKQAITNLHQWAKEAKMRGWLSNND
jgi:hypothetical protein